jgi:hypothetical protein
MGKRRIARLTDDGEFALVLLRVAEPVWPDQDDDRPGRIEGFLQLADPRQPRRKIAAIEEGCEAPRPQRGIDVLGVARVHARVTHKDVVSFDPQGEVRANR